MKITRNTRKERGGPPKNQHKTLNTKAIETKKEVPTDVLRTQKYLIGQRNRHHFTISSISETRVLLFSMSFKTNSDDLKKCTCRLKGGSLLILMCRKM